MNSTRDTLPREVQDLIDSYVSTLVASAPVPTEEQIAQLRRWFVPRREVDQRREPDAA